MAPRRKLPLLYPRQRGLYTPSKRAVDRRFLSIYMALVFFLLFGCLFLSQLVTDGPNGGALLDPLEPGLLDEMFQPRSPSEEDRRASPGGGDSSEQDSLPNVNMSTLFKLADSRPDHWQRVRRTSDRFFVFSAYLDARRNRLVRIVAAARTRLTDRVVCRLFWKGADSEYQAATVLASNKLIRENWNLRYSAFFLLCPLPPSMAGETPLWVSVQRLNDRSLPRNVLVIHRKDESAPDRRPYEDRELAVCVKPIHYEYNKVGDEAA